jgi:hypothetical protein
VHGTGSAEPPGQYDPTLHSVQLPPAPAHDVEVMETLAYAAAQAHVCGCAAMPTLQKFPAPHGRHAPIVPLHDAAVLDVAA